MVIDKSGQWLGSWMQRMQRLGATHLRTPVTLHPHASPIELQTFAEKHGRLEVGSFHTVSDTCNSCSDQSLLLTYLQQELLPVNHHFAPLPSTELMMDFCQEKIIKCLPPDVRDVMQDEVLAAEPTKDGT